MRALNRSLLARQMLLERRTLPVDTALRALVGMQAQEPQAPYLGLWSRLEGFDPHELSELIASRAAVRGPLMRATIHLVCADDWTGLRPLIQPVLARGLGSSPFSKPLAGVDVGALLEHGRELLAERPRSRAELGPLLTARWPGVDPSALAHAVSYLEPIVQVPPRGLWRQSAQARWALAEAWLGRRDRQITLESLIERYLAAFGPATVPDIQAWSGLTGLGQVVERMRGRLRSMQDEHGRELLDVPGGPLPDPETSATPRFLPPFDNAILSHRDRARIIAAADRREVFRDRMMRTFLVDGFVAGGWQLDRATLRIRPFRPLRAADRSAVDDEAERLAAFLGPDDSRLDIRICRR